LWNNKFFNIFKTNPFPIIDNENLLFTLFYLFIDETQIHYLPINEKQFDKCIQIKPGNYICKQEQPTVIASNMDNCELKLFTNSGTIPKSCDKRIIHSDQCSIK